MCIHIIILFNYYYYTGASELTDLQHVAIFLANLPHQTIYQTTNKHTSRFNLLVCNLDFGYTEP